MAERFSGFPNDALQFLAELAVCQDREWFDANKQRYEASVRDPALSFIRAVGAKLTTISSHFVASDKKVGGSLMRIHRDVRFAKDKAPYKTNIGIQFRHEVGKDVHAPGIYVHLDPDSSFLGVGLWHPEPTALAAIRTKIVDDPKAWTRVRRGQAFAETFELKGESLQRPPRGFDADHPLIEDLKRKDFIAVSDLPMALMTTSKAVDEVLRRTKVAARYLEFLCASLDLAF